MRFVSKFIEINFYTNIISKLNRKKRYTIIVATEKEGDKLQMKSKLVAIICSMILFFSIINVNAEGTAKKVIPGGIPFGLKLFTDGVVVIKVDENSPADDAKIKVNDNIVKANDMAVESNEQLKQIIENSNAQDIKITIKRNNKEIEKTITPTLSDDKVYIAGMWIRDSTAGIGTVTYFDNKTGTFGALGHGICDKDTGMLMPLRDGEISTATISTCSKTQDGCIGGLYGYFDNETIGSITKNNGYGIYGNYNYTTNTEAIEIASADEIKQGKAKILSTIEGNIPKEYEVNIDSIDINKNSGQNFVLTVTDKELLDKTGGIVQGMSGSPIIQNGKLIGAVTHVFINTPQKGYGIFIENMINAQ